MRQKFPQLLRGKWLAITIAFLLFASPLAAFAQAPAAISGAVNLGTTAITSCTGIGDKIQGLFGGGGSPFDTSEDSVTDNVAQAGQQVGSAVGQAMAVPTYDSSVETQLKTANRTQEKIKQEQEKLRKKETCLDALAYNVAKTMLDELGDMTVTWINNGFEGNPLYIEDYGTYFSWWYDTQREAFYNDLLSSNNPFASTTVTILNGEQTKGFNINFNLDQYNNDWEGFYEGDNFDWDSYTAMTELANNPIGTLLSSSDELSRQLEDRQTQVQMDLNSNGGFISYQTCVDANGNQAVYPATTIDPVTGQTIPHPKAGDDMSIFDPDCDHRKINTPGSIVADQITQDLGTSRRQLELADELNEVLADVFNALLNKAMQEGLDAI